MASERGPTATEARRTTSTAPPPAPANLAPVADLSRQKSLKRARETTPTSPDAVSGGDLSPSKIARLVGFASESHAPGEAAEDEGSGREEENQQQQLAQSGNSDNQCLMSGVKPDMDQSQDGPSDTGQSEIEAAAAAAARALSSVAIPTGHGAAHDLQGVSPQSGSSGASLEDGEGQVVDSPVVMEVDSRNHESPYAPQPEAQMEDKPATSLPYPGPVPAAGSMPAPAPPQRVMSMPIPSPQTPSTAVGDLLVPRSPSSKKHKCPYCETEFTRHHNLKSHLLTHSQEKPYLCHNCQMRFRRLHDLKRHSKLHTGEKPHVCPNCNRKFARGDALARHSKGAGGCAGRRQTMGSIDLREGFAADDSAMSGDLYEDGTGADMTEEERRQMSMPSIKTQHVAGQAGAEGHAGGHSNTYPPALRPGVASGLYPPTTDRGSSNSNTSPSTHTPHTSLSSVPLSAGGSSMYSQSGMTESPKPLSPAGVQANGAGQQRPANEQRQRGRGLSLPSHGNVPPGQHAAGRGGARAASGSTPAQGGEDNNDYAGPDPGVWAYFQHLEGKVKGLTTQMEAEAISKAQLLEKLAAHDQHIAALTDEVAALRQQLAESQQDASAMESAAAQQ